MKIKGTTGWYSTLWSGNQTTWLGWTLTLNTFQDYEVRSSSSMEKVMVNVADSFNLIYSSANEQSEESKTDISIN